MMQLSREAQNLNWLVGGFTSKIPGVAHSIVVSSDGLLLAMSNRLDRAQADQLAAVASGLTSLTLGASRVFGGGPVTQTVCEMDKGFLLAMPISEGSTLAVLASLDSDIGQVGYEMALLVSQVGAVLTPALRAELQAALPR
jgi:predicted regulator of Ras-like GTPase activity (Roadblock/LC7/MglB family)